MKIALIRKNSWPPGGWQFVQPEIPYSNPHPLAGIDHIAEQLALIRKRNPRHKLPTDIDSARDAIIAYNYHRLPPEQRIKFFQTDEQVADVKKNAPTSLSQRVAGLVGTVKQAFVGSKTLIEAFGGDGRPVAQELADKRASVCLECPLNVDKGESFKTKVAAKIKDLIEAKNHLKLHAKGEARLHICDACGCDLPLKVWTPLAHIIANLPSEDYDKLHPRCWVRSEQESPQIIPLRARIDNWSGYGQFSTQIANEFLKMGYELSVLETSLDNQFGGVSRELTRRLRKVNEQPWEFVIYPCVIQPSQIDDVILRKPTIYFTMWESTGITEKAKRFMNRCKLLIVPSQWNLEVFKNAGISIPIKVVQLGFDTAGYEYAPMPPWRPFIFGCAGKTNCGGIRKGFQVVVDAFLKAFPKEKDVELRLKAFEDDPRPRMPVDPRITMLNKYLTPTALVDWFKSIHCFVSGSHSEGWGLMQQQAMCIGRPVVGIDFGGVKEFFRPSNGYPVGWSMEPARGVYEGLGSWAKPDVTSMADQMRLAYEDRKLLETKSHQATAMAHRFTIKRTADGLIETFKEMGYL